MKWAQRVFAAAVAIAMLSAPAHAQSLKRVPFYFDQKAYVYSRLGPGGLAFVPADAVTVSGDPQTLPVVVYFHGLNTEGKSHPSFDGQENDPSVIAQALMGGEHKVAPFVLLAPTHARDAGGTEAMFHDFNLDAFLQSAQDNLPVLLDRKRVVLVGHSGGGCSTRGGALGDYPHVLGVVLADTCINAKTNQRVRALATQSRVFAYADTHWQRPFADMRAVCTGENCSFSLQTIEGSDPHRTVLRVALTDALPQLLPSTAKR